MHSVITEGLRRWRTTIRHKGKGETKQENTQTDWVLCSEDWRDPKKRSRMPSSNLANAGNHTKRRQRRWNDCIS